MPATWEAPTLTDLYVRDEVAWYGSMIELIELGRTEALDLVNLKEFLQDMSRSQRHAVKSRLLVLLTHWLKWEYQPEKRIGSWRATLQTQHFQLKYDLSESKVLRNYLAGEYDSVYVDAAQVACSETGLPPETFPETCPVTLDELRIHFSDTGQCHRLQTQARAAR